MNPRINELLNNLRKELGYDEEGGVWDIRNVNNEKIDINLISDIKILYWNTAGFFDELGKLSGEGYFGVGMCIVDPVTGERLPRPSTQDRKVDEEISSELMAYTWTVFVKLKRH